MHVKYGSGGADNKNKSIFEYKELSQLIEIDNTDDKKKIIVNIKTAVNDFGFSSKGILLANIPTGRRWQ
jgi:hypothetical protein